MSDDRRRKSEGKAPTRRDFLRSTAAGILATAVGRDSAAAQTAPPGSQEEDSTTFRSEWPADVTRVWPGPEYWTNPLQDWRIADGRLEMIAGGRDRNVHLLTRQLGSAPGRLEAAVRLGHAAGADAGDRAGLLIGVRGPLGDYRNNAIHGRGTGIRAGLSAGGTLFVEGGEERQLSEPVSREQGVELGLTAEPSGRGYTVVLSAYRPGASQPLAQVSRRNVPSDQMAGNLALFSDSAETAERGAPRVWFADWRIGGDKVEAHDARAFGPVLFAQHTLSRGVMKMTAQMPPLGPRDSQEVRLQIRRPGRTEWEGIGRAGIDPLSRTATLRVPDWDSSQDVQYRLAYALSRGGGRTEDRYFRGTIRRDPADKGEIVVGGLSCMTDAVFPHEHVVRGVRYHDPDVLFFMGDQLYEGSGGYGVQRNANVPLASLDYLRKWYLHGWTFVDLLRDRPAVCLTDDHDVYHGNIWGEGGEDVDDFSDHPKGGYFMPAEWVNMVQRTQTSHLPDAYDPTPVKQGIGVYYTDMLYGRVSFALLEDRKWKSGPEGLVPPQPGRPDHITDPNFDPKSIDVPGAVLLGERQHAFLENWAADWRGVDVKMAVSQTIFAQIPNIHGEDRMELVADLDSNGWPQTPRDEALRLIRQASALHLCGDQHLPMLVRYGVDDWDDASYAFCVPAISNAYLRAFRPPRPGRNAQPGMPGYTGQFLDGLGNRVTVHAVANPAARQRQPPIQRQADRSCGYGIVRVSRSSGKITMECWPLLSDPAGGDRGQFTGWPRTIDARENDGRAAQAWLPTLAFEGVSDPIVQVVDEADGRAVYTLRARGTRFRPGAFHEGSYTVRIGDDSGWRKTLENVRATRGGEGELRVSLG